MNEDHADAMLAWVRARETGDGTGPGPRARSVRMVSIDARGVTLEYENAVGTSRRRIALDPPPRDAAEVRARLVEMTREARSTLERAATGRDGDDGRNG